MIGTQTDCNASKLIRPTVVGVAEDGIVRMWSAVSGEFYFTATFFDCRYYKAAYLGQKLF